MSGRLAVGLLASSGATLVVGYAVLYALGLARHHGRVRLAGLAYLAGWCVLGSALAYEVMAGADPDLTAFGLTALGLVAGCAAIGRRTAELPVPGGRRESGPLAALALRVGAATIALTALAALAVASRLRWATGPWPTLSTDDLYSFWLPRAQLLYYSHGITLGPDGWQSTFHPEYPPLVPVMDAVGFHFAGGFHPTLLALQQLVLGLAFVAAILALLDRCVPRWLAFASVALLFAAPSFFGRLQALLPDQTLAYLVAAGALTCVLWLRERRGAWLVLSVVLLATATLTKLEGETYAVLLALIVAGGAALQRDWRTARPALVLFLAPAAIEPWRLWLGSHRLPTSASDYHLSSLLHPLFLAHRAGRLPRALDGVLGALFKPSDWLVILPLALLSLALLARRRPLLAAAASAWLALATAGLVAVYWIGSIPVDTYVSETAQRVAGTIVIVAGTMLPVLLGLGLEPAADGSAGERHAGAPLASRP